MAKFLTEFHSVSHGADEFVAAGGVVEIPDEQAPAFAAFIESGELVKVDDAPEPAEKSLDDAADDKAQKKGKRG